jgi:MFS family permease
MGMIERTPWNLLPLLRAIQGVIIGTVISLALFVAAFRFPRSRPVTDDETGGLGIAFFAITAGALLGALVGGTVGSRWAEKKHPPATKVVQHPLSDKEVQ